MGVGAVNDANPSVDESQVSVGDCVFCRIVAEEEPAEVIHKTEAALTIVPLNPVTEGHWLVIPRQHAEFIYRLDPKNLAYTMYDVASMAFDAHPCNIIQSNGVEATQSVPHVHFHIVPRREGDGLKLPWTGQGIGLAEPAALNNALVDVGEQIRAHELGES